MIRNLFSSLIIILSVSLSWAQAPEIVDPILNGLQNRRAIDSRQNNVTLHGNQAVYGDKIFENDVYFNGTESHSGACTFSGATTITNLTVTHSTITNITTTNLNTPYIWNKSIPRRSGTSPITLTNTSDTTWVDISGSAFEIPISSSHYLVSIHVRATAPAGTDYQVKIGGFSFNIDTSDVVYGQGFCDGCGNGANDIHYLYLDTFTSSTLTFTFHNGDNADAGTIYQLSFLLLVPY